MKKFMITVRDIILTLLLTVISMMAGGFWLSSWEVNKIALPLHYLFAPIIELIVFLLLFRWLKRKVFHDSFTAISFPPTFHKRYFGYAVGLLILCYVGAFLMGGQVIFPKMDNYLFAQNAASFLGTALISPFIEETVFRVVILTQIAKRYGVKSGVGISSLLFGIVHLMNGALDFTSAVQLIISGTLMGILLGVVFVKEQSVWAGFTIHALYNAVGTLFPVETVATNDWPIQFILHTKNSLITGGEYGIDCSIINMVSYLILIFVVVWLTHRNGKKQ